jgi:cell division septum initiation protein DivIVA
MHADDYPSWPGRPGPGALHPDHPSWPGRPDPRWAAAEAELRADDYPSWPGGQAAPVPAPTRAPTPAPAWDAGSVELAGWILSEANAHAAEIRHEARDQAAASLADAKKEAADLLRQASDRAAAKLAAVESEAAQVQAALMKLSTELGEAAATTLHPAGHPAAD